MRKKGSKISIEDNLAIDCDGPVIGLPPIEHLEEFNFKRNSLIRHKGAFVKFMEREPSFVEAWGFPKNTKPEQIADLIFAIQGKEPREAKEFIESSSFAKKLLSLGTYGNLAQISSLIFQVSADPRVQQFLSA
jgi:hypothetical protein